MDIGNLPIFSGDKKTTKSRSNDISDTKAAKNPWEEIGDYNEGPATNGNMNDTDEEESEVEQRETVVKTPSAKERQESDDAASIASQAAVKESKKNQLQK